VSADERERRLSALADRFLDEAAALGASADEAIARLRGRRDERDEGDHSDAIDHAIEQ
jgi:hypothetical protein